MWPSPTPCSPEMPCRSSKTQVSTGSGAPIAFPTPAMPLAWQPALPTHCKTHTRTTPLDTSKDLDERTMADAWAYIQAQADAGVPLRPNAYRLAFGDPEFLLRRETRGIRLQLELLKPDLDQTEMGIENTIVVFGSARFSSMEDA